MYRVMIVDDEVWALKGIRRLLENLTEQFLIVFETTDPVEALEKICTEKPDVVFTDVRMPEISGIELMYRVRERGIDTSFVVISGFADFSYVQQALQEGAVDYQLKPLDVHKTDKMLERLFVKMENKRSFEELNLYAAFRSGQSNYRWLLQKKMRKPLYKRYQVVTICFKTVDFNKMMWDSGSKSQQLFLKLGPCKCICIINSEADKTDDIVKYLMSRTEEINSAGISQSVANIDKISMLMKHSELASRDCFSDSAKVISPYRPANIAAITKLWKKIAGELKNHNYKYLKQIILKIPEYFIDNKLTAEDAVSLWNQIVISTQDDIAAEETLADLEYLDVNGLIEKFADITEMSEYLYEQLPHHDKTQTGTVNHQFTKLLDYISEHYMENLYLKELCLRFFINMSYCCELFRKVEGMTFTQYITSLRINNACVLLQSSRLTIQEVCERVGYNDYFYFNKVFKRNIGCTPYEYRKNKEGQEHHALD